MKYTLIVFCVVFTALLVGAAEVPSARIYTAAGELVVPTAANGKVAKIHANPSAARLSERTEGMAKRGKPVQLGTLGARMTEMPS